MGGATSRIALVTGTAVTVLRGRQTACRMKMQFTAAVGTENQVGKQPLPFRLLGRAALEKPIQNTPQNVPKSIDIH